MANSHTWFDKIRARIKRDRDAIEKLEHEPESEEEKNFLKSASSFKKYQLREGTPQGPGGEDEE